VAVDSSGNVYVADLGNSTIRKITPEAAGGQTTWVVSTIGGLAMNVGGADGTGSAARFNKPVNLTVDSRGVLYVCDNVMNPFPAESGIGNGTIRMGVPPATPFAIGGLTMANGQTQIRFSAPAGSVSAFKLLNAGQPNGPWTTNTSAVLTTNAPSGAYSFTTPLNPGSAQFYRVQSQ
jgi:hypothetical protein